MQVTSLCCQVLNWFPVLGVFLKQGLNKVLNYSAISLLLFEVPWILLVMKTSQMHMFYAPFGLWSVAWYRTTYSKAVTSKYCPSVSYPACRDLLCFPETWPKARSLLEQRTDQKWCHLCFAAAFLPAVSCDVEFYAILLGFCASFSPQYIALVGISGGFWSLGALTCIISSQPRSKPWVLLLLGFNSQERYGLSWRFQNKAAGLVWKLVISYSPVTVKSLFWS